MKRRKRRRRKLAFDDEQWARLVRTYIYEESERKSESSRIKAFFNFILQP